MKRLLLALSLGAAVLGVSACAGAYGPDSGRGLAYYDHGPIGFDGFYDDAYGPFYDGYWGDGGFYYSTGEGRPYQLDRGNHFRHDAFDGFHAFHGGMHAGAMRGGGHGDDHHH